MLKSFCTLVLPLGLLACTTPEQDFASDAQLLFAGGQSDLAHMCGAIGEVLLERGEFLRHNAVQARTSSASIIAETADYVDAQARVKAGASGYLSSLMTFRCRFARSVSVTPPWHELVALELNGNVFGDKSLANVNALGASLAGSYQEHAL